MLKRNITNSYELLILKLNVIFYVITQGIF